ncbi:S1-like domain-containing RNA-binding protein [Gilvimarinus sp. SDUM040013]|uniref:S1-like domain-containing RNA-binding protein n=1 Tax=Gilvimarinus gilvus TaxID=3058038 RepID=A0ABU4RUD3_9GAMM|nr:S1-like domain-containing RNA-binding protein [Gilvimarinus sp. SDUM040013]MDO3385110.1 S1-like domain-containing RNA-binding protein [Gilvimarinus sp. SDUM040013]MDX6848485.1 S1-like domain-containing RNA-binding protein [Gilvimarinus sp. SDUM040013]
MASIGQYDQLPIVKFVDFGAYLDAGELGQVLLPKRYVTEEMGLGQSVDVFIHHDSQDIPVATTLRPKATVGQSALLKVVDINDAGAFLDWGLPKHLLVPFNEQHKRFEIDRSYVVTLYLDPYSERVVGSSRLSRHLNETGTELKVGQAVDLLICGRSDMGFKAVINHRHLGLIFRDDAFKPLCYGEKTKGYVKAVRRDGKIDISLQPVGDKGRDRLQQKILDHLSSNNGHSELGDRANPDDIYKTFNVSKGTYKKALGALYKQRLIVIKPDGIELIGE